MRKISNRKSFQVLPRRWVVERTFGWMTRWRRLVRDYEVRCVVSGGMTYLAMGALMLRRLAQP
jgi:transposase